MTQTLGWKTDTLVSNTSDLAAILSIALQEIYLKAKRETSSWHISFKEQNNKNLLRSPNHGSRRLSKTLIPWRSSKTKNSWLRINTLGFVFEILSNITKTDVISTWLKMQYFADQTIAYLSFNFEILQDDHF